MRSRHRLANLGAVRALAGRLQARLAGCGDPATAWVLLGLASQVVSRTLAGLDAHDLAHARRRRYARGILRTRCVQDVPALASVPHA